MLKAFLIFKIFRSWLFGRVGKRLDKKANVNFKIFDTTTANK